MHPSLQIWWNITTYQRKTINLLGLFTKTYQKYWRFTPSREYKILASNPAASEALSQLSKGIRRNF